MNWLFYLDGREIEEPIGWSDLEMSIKRDEQYHGMTFEVSLSTLQFYGLAADYLKQVYDNQGIKGSVNFEAYVSCETYDYELAFSGRVNFGKYKYTCGTVCLVEVPIESQSCELVLKSRYDQKVDMDKLIAQDGITPLVDYVKLPFTLTLPPKQIPVSVEGYVAAPKEVLDIELVPSIPGVGSFGFDVRPTYDDVRDNSINQGELTPTNNYTQLTEDNTFPPLSPQLLLDDSPQCFSGQYSIDFRLKGRFSINTNIQGLSGTMFTGRWDGEGVLQDLTILNAQNFYAEDNYTAGTIIEFDQGYAVTMPLVQGEGLYNFIELAAFEADTETPTIHIEFDPESKVVITAVKECPATDTEAYAIHETLSRVAEYVTNGCVRVKSAYYGRVDSQPFAFPEDGCGGLRVVTSGLKIRQADNDKFFASMKDLIEGLNGVDNIGMDVIEDPDTAGKFLLRVEDAPFFYEDVELFRHDGVPIAESQVEEARHYSRILVGYKKWEVENIKGLDEFNSNREYTTSLDTISSTLDITSALIAGSYAIEITRQQQFAESGGADTKYDNDIFIIVVKRDGYAYAEMVVEQGNISSPENIFSPSTIYNYRISPVRNLMRWYKSIAAGFKIVADAANKLFFSSGTGNILAKGMQDSVDCRIESFPIQENQNIFVTQFANTQDWTPIWVNEEISYEYPMSVADYKLMKLHPYRYISVQCGAGIYVKYWIREIKYNMAQGMATFNLRLKYGV